MLWSFKWADERVWAKKCMEHEWDWPVFESTLIYERGKRCRGGKKSKERATWAFFVTASGEKDTPIVVGRSLNPRCFKSLKNSSRLRKCDYFSSSRAWMASEIFERFSFEADELTARVATYSCFLRDSINCRLLLEISSLPLLQLRVFTFYLKFANLTTQVDLSSLPVAALPKSFLPY